MHDIRWIRDNPEAFDRGLKRRGLEPQAQEIIALDEERRRSIRLTQEAQTEANATSKLIGGALARGDQEEAARLKAKVADLKAKIHEEDVRADASEAALKQLLEIIPNLPLDEVPDGADADHNREIRRHGEPPSFDFTPKQHFELGEGLGLMDFETAAKLSGARFVVLKGKLARLERALGQFMLDLQTREHGYQEVNPPFLVREQTMYGTGQLPKFRDDQFQT